MGMGSFGSGSPTRTQHQLSSSFAGDSVIEGNLLIAGNLGVSGSFGLGTSTPSVGSTKGLDIENTTASSATEGGAIRLGCNDGAVMASGHRLGVIEFAGAEDTSSTMTVGARIEALCDATWSASENGAALLFYTTDGNASQSEQMRILAGGNVGIGVADPDTKLEVGGKIHISGETTTPSQPAGGDGGILYVKADGKLYWRSNEIAEVDISASGGGSGDVSAGSTFTTAGVIMACDGDDKTIDEPGATLTTNSQGLTVSGVTKVGASAGSGQDLFVYTAGAAAHVGLQWDADGNTEGTLIGGADDHGVDFKFFGETSGKYVQWDMSGDLLAVKGTFYADGVSLSNNDSGTSNTVLGLNAGANIASGGNYNIMLGEEAGNDFTTGDNNVIIGYQAGDKTTDVDNSVIIGYQAGRAIMTADADGTVLIGKAAGAAITEGVWNVAVGHQALNAEAQGNLSTAIGYNALLAQTGVNGTVGNTAVGALAGDAVTTGIKNVFVGVNAGGATETVTQAVVVGYGAGTGNMTAAAAGTTIIGHGACAALTTGAGNVAVGFEALKTNVDGDFNTAVGYQALETFEADSDGHGKNTAVGYNAGQAVSTGTGNTIVGSDAGDALAGGDDNTFLGEGAGGATTAGGSLVIIGKGAGAAVMTADANGTVAIGATAGAALTSGEKNVAIGYQALLVETIGDQNTAVGYNALTSQVGTTGEAGNTAVGYQAGQFATTATGCTFIGNQCGQGITGAKLTGNDNTVVGSDAGLLLQGAGNSNTLVGGTAGDAITTGIGNVVVGNAADISAATGMNQIVIGGSATGQGNHIAVVGNANATDFYAAQDKGAKVWCTNIDSTSDARIKKNVNSLSLGLEFINKLNPVTFNMRKAEEWDEELKVEQGWFKRSETPRQIDDKEGKVGFIAQEVKQALDECNVECDIHVVGHDGIHSLDYSRFVAPLVKAVQELSAKVEELEAKLGE